MTGMWMSRSPWTIFNCRNLTPAKRLNCSSHLNLKPLPWNFLKKQTNQTKSIKWSTPLPTWKIWCRNLKTTGCLPLTQRPQALIPCGRILWACPFHTWMIPDSTSRWPTPTRAGYRCRRKKMSFVFSSRCLKIRTSLKWARTSNMTSLFWPGTASRSKALCSTP